MKNQADGFLGAVIASESLGFTDTLINGAGGCRSRAQIMMHDLIPEYYPENAGCCRSKYFSRQSRLPCTYLNNGDIVFGTREKVSDGVKSASSVTKKRVLLLDTLGASLVCSDYSGILDSNGDAPITVGDLSGMTFNEGYDRTTAAILSCMDVGEGKDGSVNLLGYGIMDPGWDTGADGLCQLIESMGITVNCVLGCIPSADSIRSVGKASLNIMVRPEFCTITADMLNEKSGTPFLRPSMGAPVGYPALRSFVKEVADALGKDPAPALEMIDRDAQAVHRILMNYDKIPMTLHAKGFVIEGESSTAYPLLRWMVESFAMSPRRITLADDAYRKEIEDYLSSKGFPDAMGGVEGEVEAVFSDGLDALESRLSKNPEAHVEIRLPRGRYMDLMGRTVVGLRGCRYILDELMNGITRFRCGQPTGVEYRPGYQE